MKKILAKIDEWIGTHIKLDDTLHFIAGIVIAMITYMIALPYFGFDVDYHLVSAWAFFVTLFAAIFKEAIIDKLIKGTDQSLRDIIATCAGGVLAIIFMEIFKAMNIFVDMYVREEIMNNWIN